MLYIVSTPIGNLQDITLRALETLRNVDFVVCEDTRVTSFLLHHFEIKKELVSMNAFSEKNKLNFIADRIENGSTCALVSDAGTPGISDPGVRLISEVIRRKINVVPIPGVSAAITAISVSGLPTDSFIFEGFLPQKKGRQKKLQNLLTEDRTVILYESTYRIKKLLEELSNYAPDRLIAVCRELTKKFEEIVRGFPHEISSHFELKEPKGEFVVIIAPISWKQISSNSHPHIEQ
jgi:16S rRNA (cytidine1402-2'-O)-methyltransferase